MPLNCPAGVPLGNVRLRVEGDPGKELLPLRSMNRLGEGDTIYYSPVKLRLKHEARQAPGLVDLEVRRLS